MVCKATWHSHSKTTDEMGKGTEMLMKNINLYAYE